MRGLPLAKLVVVAGMLGICTWLLALEIGFDSPWLGLLLMLNFMGIAKVAEPLFVLPLPPALRDVATNLPESPMLRRLGVDAFGRLLRNTPLRYLNDSVYRAGGRRSLAEVRRQAASAEAIHFWAAVGFTPYIAWIATRGLVTQAILFTAVQIAFNVYPILHLRIVRARIVRLGRSPRAE